MADILVLARVELAEAVEWYDAREDGLGGRLAVAGVARVEGYDFEFLGVALCLGLPAVVLLACVPWLSGRRGRRQVRRALPSLLPRQETHPGHDPSSRERLQDGEVEPGRRPVAELPPEPLDPRFNTSPATPITTYVT